MYTTRLCNNLHQVHSKSTDWKSYYYEKKVDDQQLIAPVSAKPYRGAMVNVLASSAVDRGFEARSGKTKDYEIGIWFCSAEYASLR